MSGQEEVEQELPVITNDPIKLELTLPRDLYHALNKISGFHYQKPETYAIEAIKTCILSEIDTGFPAIVRRLREVLTEFMHLV